MADDKQDRTLQEIIHINSSAGYGYSIEQYTCYSCVDWKNCPFAWDGYNTEGDCLEDK